MIGGFSACRHIIDDFKTEFNVPIIYFDYGQSLAIVKGAAVFYQFDIKKKVLQGIGLEFLKPIADLSQA